MRNLNLEYDQIQTRQSLSFWLEKPISFILCGVIWCIVWTLKGPTPKLKIQPNVFLMHLKSRLDPICLTLSSHPSQFSLSLACNASATRPCTPEHSISQWTIQVSNWSKQTSFSYYSWKETNYTCCGLMILVSGSSNDSFQCDKYPAMRGIANKTVKNSGGNPIALF